MADVAYFRTRFPEFDSPVAEDPVVQYWLDDAELFVIESKWEKWYDIGHSLFAAHNLALSIQRQKVAGGDQGQMNVSSQSADGLSVTFATGITSSTDEVWFNKTPYGTEYWRLLQLVGIPAAFAVSPLAEV